jgi:hypothetical protein
MMENLEAIVELRAMVASSKQGDYLLYFFWEHGNGDGMDFGPMHV